MKTLQLKFFILTFSLPLLFSLFFPSSIQSKIAQKEGENPTFWQWNLPSGSYAVHYIERGKGPRHVMLQHGFAAHSYTWRFMIDVLAAAGYHVWSMDLIGFGLSDKPSEAPYHLQFFTHQIEAFMQAKEIPQASFIGNSMGGGLALAMSIYFPRRVQSLVLIDAFAFPMKFPFQFTLVKKLGKLSKPFLGKFTVRQILKKLISDPNKISEEQVNAYAFPLLAPGGKDAFIKTLQNFDEKELEKLTLLYKNIRVPMLIIWGEKDPWMPLDYFQKVVQAFPKAKTVLIRNCGHAPQEECPSEVNRAVLQFLDSLPMPTNYW